MGKVTQVKNGDNGLPARIAYNNAIQAAETTGDIEGDGNVGSELDLTAAAKAKLAKADTATQPGDLGSAANAEIADFATAAQGSKADSAQQPPTEGAFIDGDKTKLDSATQPADFAPQVTTGAAGTLTFDNRLGGRRYADTKTLSTITFDFTGAVDGGMVQFVSDGTEITTITSTKTVYINGEQDTGNVGSLFAYYDATDDVVYANWSPSAAAGAPSLDAPTFNLVAGDGELTYNSVVTDANATYNVMEIKTSAGSTWYTVTGAEFTDGDTSGTITEINSVALSNGTAYDVRITSSASGYTNGTATESATPNDSTLLSDTFTGVTIDTGKWTVKNPDPTEVDISQNDALIIEQLIDGGTTANQANGVDSVSSFDASGILVLKFDSNITCGNEPSYFNIGFGDGTFDNLIVMDRVSGASTTVWQYRVREGGVAGASATLTGSPSLTGAQSWKIIKAANGDISLSKWNVSTWDIIDSGISSGFTSGTLKVTMSCNASDVSSGLTTLNYDNLYVTDTDFITLNP